MNSKIDWQHKKTFLCTWIWIAAVPERETDINQWRRFLLHTSESLPVWPKCVCANCAWSFCCETGTAMRAEDAECRDGQELFWKAKTGPAGWREGCFSWVHWSPLPVLQVSLKLLAGLLCHILTRSHWPVGDGVTWHRNPSFASARDKKLKIKLLLSSRPPQPVAPLSILLNALCNASWISVDSHKSLYVCDCIHVAL